jgi:hypothetical protein
VMEQGEQAGQHDHDAAEGEQGAFYRHNRFL